MRSCVEKNKASGHRGVSLLETVIYVAILASMLVMVVNTLLALNTSFTGIRLSKEMNVSAQVALERISSEVKKAKQVDQTASIFNVNPSVLALSTTDDSDNPITILFSVSNGVLRITSNGVDLGALTRERVIVSNFTVGFIDTVRSNAVTVTLGLSGTRGKIALSNTFRTAAVTRNQEK